MAVDHRESLVELREILHRALRRDLHRLADTMRYGVEPLGHSARKLRLPARQHLAHRVHAPGRFGLQARHLGQALLQFLRALALQRHLDVAPAGYTAEHYGDACKQREYDAAERSERFADTNRHAADGEKGFGHSPLVRDSSPRNEQRTQNRAFFNGRANETFVFRRGSVPAALADPHWGELEGEEICASSS